MDSSTSFEVLTYSRDNLACALSNEFITKEALLAVGQMIPESESSPPSNYDSTRLLFGGNLYNFPYLLTYLADDGIGAKTILVEHHFTSRDFLSDYATYYATCKRRYAKECKRVHFFAEEYTEEDIRKWLFPQAFPGEDRIDPQPHYLGYVVVKPIPFSFMGTTLLKPFPAEGNSRVFSVTKDYRINIFGQLLRLNTLAFQSQDKATSACASSALWSAFHRTSAMFQTQNPTPSEITVFSGNLYTSEGRSFPNTGLDHHQICKSIERVGLVSELRNQFGGWSLQIFKGFVYGYLKMGLPILLGMEILGAEKHLVTLTGFRKAAMPEKREQGLFLVSDAISRFYAHDDQLGPFSRIEVQETNELQFPCGIKIITGWPKNGSFDDLRAARLSSLVIPMHAHIRIRYEEIYQIVKRFDALIDAGGTNNYWDVFLDDGSRLKTEFAQLPLPPGKAFSLGYLRATLLHSIPRFVWRAQLHFQNYKVMELLFDATDVPRGHYLLAATYHHPGFQQMMKGALAPDSAFGKQLDDLFGRQFREILRENAEIPIFDSTRTTV